VFWRCLTGEHVSNPLALTKLTNYFAKKANSTSNKSIFTVLLLDEIDFLATGNGNVFYSFFNWPLMVNARLALIGISNVMDLPDRLAGKVQARVSTSMTRVSFRPYTFDQVS
jgi:Cdc6-like AAA superfamily ATPase